MMGRFLHQLTSCLGCAFIMFLFIIALVVFVDYVISQQQRRYYGDLVEVEYYERPVTPQEVDYERRAFDSVLRTLQAWNDNGFNHPKIPSRLLPFLAVQVVHETDFLRSAICRDNNNWFGMKKAVERARTLVDENRGHASYAHISESIRDMVYYLSTFNILSDNSITTINDYCSRLQRNRYAQDPKYCAKLQQLYRRLITEK